MPALRPALLSTQIADFYCACVVPCLVNKLYSYSVCYDYSYLNFNNVRGRYNVIIVIAGYMYVNCTACNIASYSELSYSFNKV